MKEKQRRTFQIGYGALRFLMAFALLFSGMMKAIDPRGTAYKLEEYLNYFGLQMFNSEYLLLAGSIILCSVEFLLGIYWFWGIRRRFTSYFTLFLCGVFLLFSIFIAIFHPVSDCGCFGDAIHLTDGQTLVKNIVLLSMAAVLFYYRRYAVSFLPPFWHWLVSLYSIAFIVFFSVWMLHTLPLIDFRPYRIGVNIRQAMEIPDDAVLPEYETSFIMQRGNEKRTFTLADYPRAEEGWTFVSTEKKLLKDGFRPLISDFCVTDTLQNDVTETLIGIHSGWTFLLISPNFKEAEKVSIDEINALNDYCIDQGYHFYALTASAPEDIRKWQYAFGAEYPILMADKTVLRTMIRSNPGLMLLHDGTVMAKWSAYDLPTPGHADIQSWVQDGKKSTQQLLKIVLFYLIPLIFITFAHKFWRRRKFYSIINKRKKMRKKIVAGNWKMNTTLQEGVELAKEINASLEADKPVCDVVICTPFIHLASVAGVINTELVKLGAENCADKEKGAYTGEVSAAMVKSTGAEYVILGHSERRAYYGETAEILKEKVNLALANNLKVIFCIGEVKEEREADKQNEVVKAQLEGSLFDLTVDQLSNIVLAYEPVWAIGTGLTATAEQAEDMHAFIRLTIAEKFGAQAAENISILYGGSCKPSNAKEIFSKPDVDGGLIGGAALKADSFKGIIDAWK